jgi:hypothetical protein
MLHGILPVLGIVQRVFFQGAGEELVAHYLDFDGAPVDGANEGTQYFEKAGDCPAELMTPVKMKFNGQVLVVSKCRRQTLQRFPQDCICRLHISRDETRNFDGQT